MTQSILPLIDTLFSLGFKIPHSTGFLPTSLVTYSWSLLLIRMPHNLFLGSLLFPTCSSLKISFILTVLNTSCAHDSHPTLHLSLYSRPRYPIGYLTISLAVHRHQKFITSKAELPSLFQTCINNLI